MWGGSARLYAVRVVRGRVVVLLLHGSVEDIPEVVGVADSPHDRVPTARQEVDATFELAVGIPWALQQPRGNYVR